MRAAERSHRHIRRHLKWRPYPLPTMVHNLCVDLSAMAQYFVNISSASASTVNAYALSVINLVLIKTLKLAP